MLRLLPASFLFALLTACPPTGVCEPGATRCSVDNPGQVEACVCDARGGELYADCRDAPHWEVVADLCRPGDQCFSDGANATVCGPENLGACTTPHPDEYCVDAQTAHRCAPWQGIVSVNPDGTFDGILIEESCQPGWVCDDTWASGEAACVLPE